MTSRIRTTLVAGENLAVPQWIYRDGPGWRIDIDRRRIAGTRFRRYVADAGRPPSTSLHEAKAIVDQAPLTRALDGRQSPSPRVSFRKLVLRRTVRDNHFAFTLSIDPSKSIWFRSWMRLFLGTQNTIDQARIDMGIAVLTARWEHFRRHASAHSIAHALDLDYDHLAPAASARAALQFDDLMAWSGVAKGIRYSPFRSVVRGP